MDDLATDLDRPDEAIVPEYEVSPASAEAATDNCPDCAGSGLNAAGDFCPTCDGTGRVSRIPTG